MRWLLAGLFFALAVVLAIGTAGIRADNVRTRRHIERDYRRVADQVVELRRLAMERLAATSPQRLAAMHWQWLRQAAARYQERLQ
ncbi:MAG TPA: hypothetical protein ENI87_14875 [bacterium]|nr:hypothetical protein [bacterium]